MLFWKKLTNESKHIDGENSGINFCQKRSLKVETVGATNRKGELPWTELL